MVAPAGNLGAARRVFRPDRDSTGNLTASRAPAVASGGNGIGAADRLAVDVGKRGELGVLRTGRDRRPLFHLGEHAFHPAGAPAVRLRFEMDGPRVTALTVVDGGVQVRALRVR